VLGEVKIFTASTPFINAYKKMVMGVGKLLIFIYFIIIPPQRLNKIVKSILGNKNNNFGFCKNVLHIKIYFS
jgi:hypothetical protein